MQSLQAQLGELQKDVSSVQAAVRDSAAVEPRAAEAPESDSEDDHDSDEDVGDAADFLRARRTNVGTDPPDAGCCAVG